MSDSEQKENIESDIEAIEITPSSSQLVKLSMVNKNDEIENLMMQAINLNSNSIYHEPTCLICSSPYRNDLEQKCNKEKTNFKDVVQIFKEKTGVDIGENVVRNHIEQHGTSGIRELQKQEYVHRIKRLNTTNLTTLEKISLAYAIISERVMGINSIVPSGEESAAEIEKIKSAETSRLMGTLNNLLKLQASILGEMKTSGELVYIPTNEFVAVFRDALRSAKTDREKELITGLLDKLESLARKTQ